MLTVALRGQVDVIKAPIADSKDKQSVQAITPVGTIKIKLKDYVMSK